MVAKKEGAHTACKNCGTDLTCRTKDYGGNYAPTLQWQNFDGTAHYKTSDGKNFTCNVPEDDPNQTRIPEPERPTATPKPANNNDVIIKEELEGINLRLDRIDEMVQAIFRYTVDKQLEGE